MKLNEMAFNINKGNKQRGFWINEHHLLGKINENEMLKPSEIQYIQTQFDVVKLSLAKTELSEAIEAIRKNKFANDIQYRIENETFNPIDFEKHIKDTQEDEIADCIIRLLDYCAEKEIDIEFFINEKLKYNATREYMHGKEF